MTTVPTTVQERIPLPTSLRAGGEGGGGGLTPGEIFAILRRRMVMITALFVAFSGMVVGGFVVWWKYFPSYEAQAFVELISNVPQTDLEDPAGARLHKDEHERFVQTQAVLVKSEEILREALGHNIVKETTWFKQLETIPERQVALDQQLNTSAVRGTNLLKVSMQTRVASDAPAIVNKVVEIWERRVKENATREYDVRNVSARAEITALTNTITERQKRLQEISDRIGPGGLDNEGSLSLKKLAETQSVELVKSVETAELKSYRDAYLDPRGAVTAEDQQIVEMDPQVSQLAGQIFLMQQQLQADLQILGEKHTVVRQSRSNMEVLQKQLDVLRNQKYRELRDQRLESAETSYQATMAALLLTQESRARAEGEFQDQQRLQREYNVVNDELRLDLERRASLQDFADKLERIKTSQTALELRIAQLAVVPLERSNPPKILLPVGVFISMLLAMASAVGLELMDTSVRTAQDITRHLEIAVLGAVPHADDEEIDIQRPELAVVESPRSVFAESIRRIRTSLQFSAPASRQRSVLITSPQPEEGATTIACNLASTLAVSGRRVLMIDANFRRPTLHRILNVPGRQGLSNVLVGSGQLSEYVASTRWPNLDVLPAGPTPPNPAELLSSDVFRAMLDDAVGRYDQVIIDAPPVLLASDAAVISTAVDGVILVLRARQHSRGAGRRAVTILSALNAHLFGAVLNAAQVTRGGYFREQLRSYYDYETGGAGGEGPGSLPVESERADRGLPSDRSS